MFDPESSALRPPLEETIAAPASPAGRGERAIVRVSGSSAPEIVRQLFEPRDPERWDAARRAERHVGQLRLDEFRTPVEATALLWPTPRSYTGQRMVELHLIGSPPIVDALLEGLYRKGARPARAGEFTLRAFLNGRLDLVQAEGVLGVIDAEDSASLRKALHQLGGGVSGRIAGCREELLIHLADLEAGLDFVEEDIEFVSRDGLINRLRDTLGLVDELLAQTGTRMHAGIRPRVVLAGLPNAGKSTLLNAISGGEAAIVSPIAGTTRDFVSSIVDCAGIEVELIDTAGAEAGQDPIMAQAQLMRGEELRHCDLIVWCRATDLSVDEQTEDARLYGIAEQTGIPILRIETKADLRIASHSHAIESAEPATQTLSVSITDNRKPTTDNLLQTIAAHLSDRGEHHGELLGSTIARCRDSLDRSAAALQQTLSAAESGLGDELISIDLRAALDALGEIAGAIYTDDILDRIFSRFCIGK